MRRRVFGLRLLLRPSRRRRTSDSPGDLNPFLNARRSIQPLPTPSWRANRRHRPSSIFPRNDGLISEKWLRWSPLPRILALICPSDWVLCKQVPTDEPTPFMKPGPPSPTRPASHRRHSKSKRRTGDKGTENECERAFPSHLHPARLPRIASADRAEVRPTRSRPRSPREADAAPAPRRDHVYASPQFAPLKGTHHDQR